MGKIRREEKEEKNRILVILHYSSGQRKDMSLWWTGQGLKYFKGLCWVGLECF